MIGKLFICIALLGCTPIVAISQETPTGRAIITGNGIGAFQINHPLPDLKPGMLVYRRVEWDEDAEEQDVAGVQIADQLVVLEMIDDKIWRMNIRKPGLETVDGIQVGTKVSEIARRIPLESLFGSGGNIFLKPKDRCGLSFSTNYEPDSTEIMKKWNRAALIKLPDSAVVDAILIVGCSN